MNEARAAWAATAVCAFQRETGADDEDALTDLLCDLMHWSDRNGVWFAASLGLAQMHYQAETAYNNEAEAENSQPESLRRNKP